MVRNVRRMLFGPMRRIAVAAATAEADAPAIRSFILGGSSHRVAMQLISDA